MNQKKVVLLSLIEEVDNLISQSVTTSDYSFRLWKSKVEKFMLTNYGANSEEYKKIMKIYYSPLVITSFTDNNDYAESCKDGMQTTKAYLESCLSDFDGEGNDTMINNSCKSSDFSKVFIVHGHDGELKEAVARIVEKQGLKAVILREQISSSNTIIEKIEKYGNVSGAICLFTADDTAKDGNGGEERYRARQNVVFEAGYFMGKLGRDRVVIIAEDGVELPGDLNGVVYTNKNSWEIDVLKELNAMGYAIDLNKLLR